MNRKVIIVGLDDGIILDLDRCVIIESDSLSEAEHHSLDFGTEVEALTVAQRHGVRLSHILQNCGYGDLNYSNCLSYSPTAICMEIDEMLATAELETEQRDLLAWARQLGNQGLEDIASIAMQFDELWSVWRYALLASIVEYKNYTETQEPNA